MFGSQFKYQQVAQYILRNIEDGTFPVNRCIPSQRDISSELEVNRVSVRRALDILEKDGVLECRPSVGTVVKRMPGQKCFIGYLVPSLDDPFHTEMIRHIDAILRNRNAALIVAEGNDIQRLLDMGIDKILQSGQVESAEVPENVKLVSIGRKAEGQDSVTVNDEIGMLEILRHLEMLGHQRLSCISSRIEFVGNLDPRCVILQRLCTEKQQKFLADNIFTLEGYSDKEYRNLLKHLLHKENKPTALICSSDWIAIKIIQEAGHLGIPVPEFFSVTGFDNIYMSSLISVPLTTVAFPIQAAAERAVADLFRISGELPVETVLDPELVVRSSTDAPFHGKYLQNSGNPKRVTAINYQQNKHLKGVMP